MSSGVTLRIMAGTVARFAASTGHRVRAGRRRRERDVAPARTRVGAVVLALGLMVVTVATVSVPQAGAATADFTVPPGVTMTEGGESCHGVVPTPGSANTNKVLDPNATQDLNPGGSASYLITFPSSASNVGTFEIVDCVLLVGAGGAPKDYKAVLGQVTFSKVNNSVDFQLAFTFQIPADAANGDQICNVAKTTASPSRSPASNRKAGPACFVIGGSGRVEKHDAATGDPLDGATFNIHDCVLGAGAVPALQPIIVSLQDANGEPILPAPAPDPVTGLVSGDVTASSIAFNGPSGSSCQVTETVAPAGYSLPPVAERTVTVLIGATRQTVRVFNDTPVPTELTLLKTSDADTVDAGEAIGYTITISNGAGASTARAVTIRDILPIGAGISWSITPEVDGCSIVDGVLACAFGDLAGGASRSVHITSPTTLQSCAAYQNTVEVESTNGAALPASATSTVLCPGLNLLKTADAPLVDAGSPIGFTVTVTNSTGSATAAAVTITDDLPSGPGISWSIEPPVTGCSITADQLTCTFSTLAGGASRSVHVVSPTTGDSCQAYPNEASLQAALGGAPNATALATVRCPSVALTKTADSPVVNAGEAVGFVIRVSNTGPTTAKAVTVSDALPVGGGLSWAIAPDLQGDACTLAGNALTCAFGDVPGESSRSVRVTSPTTAADCAVIPNVASAMLANGAAPPDATASVAVRCPALSLGKTADQPSVVAGQPIGFTITVTNGPDAGTATGVTVTDDLLAGPGLTWSIDPASPDGAGCSLVGATLSCAVGDLVAGASRSVHLVSPTTTASCRSYDNTARLTATNGSAPEATATTAVSCPSTTTPPPAVVQGVVVDQPPIPVQAAPVEAAAIEVVPTEVMGLTLPRTGRSMAGLVRLAGTSVMLGGVLLFAGRRRSTPRRSASSESSQRQRSTPPA